MTWHPGTTSAKASKRRDKVLRGSLCLITPCVMANVCVYQSRRSTIFRIAAGMHPLHARPLYRGTTSPRPTGLPRNQKAAMSEQQVRPLDAQRDTKGMGSSVNKPTRFEEVSLSALLATCLNSLMEYCGFLMYLYPSSPCHCALSTILKLPPLNGCTCNIRVRVKHDVHTSVKHQAIVSPCLAAMSEGNRDEPSILRIYMAIVAITELGSRVASESSFG